MSFKRPYQKTKEKKIFTISIDAEKVFDKPQHSFICFLKKLWKLAIKRNFLKLIKRISKNFQLVSYLMGIIQYPHTISGSRQWYLFSLFLLNIVLEFLKTGKSKGRNKTICRQHDCLHRNLPKLQKLLNKFSNVPNTRPKYKLLYFYILAMSHWNWN